MGWTTCSSLHCPRCTRAPRAWAPPPGSCSPGPRPCWWARWQSTASTCRWTSISFKWIKQYARQTCWGRRLWRCYSCSWWWLTNSGTRRLLRTFPFTFPLPINFLNLLLTIIVHFLHLRWRLVWIPCKERGQRLLPLWNWLRIVGVPPSILVPPWRSCGSCRDGPRGCRRSSSTKILPRSLGGHSPAPSDV